MLSPSYKDGLKSTAVLIARVRPLNRGAFQLALLARGNARPIPSKLNPQLNTKHIRTRSHKSFDLGLASEPPCFESNPLLLFPHLQAFDPSVHPAPSGSCRPITTFEHRRELSGSG